MKGITLGCSYLCKCFLRQAFRVFGDNVYFSQVPLSAWHRCWEEVEIDVKEGKHHIQAMMHQ